MSSPSEHATGARVAIRDGRLHLNGRPFTAFGGELQYFRVRDPGGDASRTHDMWKQTLDRMAVAGMSLLSTYVPWDWHESAPGKFRWDGDRDLPLLLELAHERGLATIIKPGPFITAEWPRGFGSFGAVPAWFRAAHPEALARRPGGKPWSFDPLGGEDQTQPMYDAPAFLEATKRWFTALAPILKRFIHERPTIAMLQLDNETNLWWADWQAIEMKGGWEERQQHCVDYHARLRKMWEGLGISEPDVLFSVNDSPFAIPGRHNLTYHGPRRNSVALGTLDTYPKGLPVGDAFTDQPFQAPYFAKLFARHASYTFAAEIQAMDLKQLFGMSAKADSRATGQILTHLFGSGVSGGVMYVIREGLNADGTLYAPAAPLDLHGNATARWTVIESFARFLDEHGDDLAAARPDERLAVATHVAHAVDAEEKGRIWSLDAPAIFGWLRMAGFDPAVLDLETASPEEIARYAGVLCARPDLLPPQARALLDCARTLVTFGGEGPARPWGRLLPGAHDGLTAHPTAGARLSFNGASGILRAWRDRRKLPAGGEVILELNGEALASRSGTRTTFATRIATPYNLPAFYGMTDEELLRLRALARELFPEVKPAFPALPVRVEAWTRGCFVFVVNHGPAVEVKLPGKVVAGGGDGGTTLGDLEWRVLRV